MKKTLTAILILTALLFAMLPVHAQVNAVDYAVLEETIANAESLSWTEYSNSDWEDILAAIDDAKKYLTSESQDEVEAAIEALDELISSKEKLNYSALEAAILATEGLVEEEYTTESWDILTKALENAEAALDIREQSEIDKATADLTEATDALVAPDYVELEAAIAEAELIEDQGYTTESWGAFVAAIESATAAQTTRAQTEIDAAKDAIVAAIAGLKAPDYAALEEIIASAKELLEISYSEENWSVILAAVESAKAKLTSISQTEIDAAVAALSATLTDTPQLAREELMAAIALANSKIEAEYTTETWSVFSKTLLAVSAKQFSRVQSDIDAALAQLVSAINVLAVPDYTDLKATIAVAQAKEKSSYTVESWMMLDAAIKTAEEALMSMSQVEIDEAKTTLDFAISSLENLEEKSDSITSAGGCSLSLTSSAAVLLTVLAFGFGMRKRED